VLSPPNREDEMDEKRALYFAAGAREVWLWRPGRCDELLHTRVLAAIECSLPAIPDSRVSDETGTATVASQADRPGQIRTSSYLIIQADRRSLL
jgi:Uma2 family endonuclease